MQDWVLFIYFRTYGLIFSCSTQDFQSTTTLKTWSLVALDRGLLYRGQMNGKTQGRNKLGWITQEVVIWRGSLRQVWLYLKNKIQYLSLTPYSLRNVVSEKLQIPKAKTELFKKTFHTLEWTSVFDTASFFS